MFFVVSLSDSSSKYCFKSQVYPGCNVIRLKYFRNFVLSRFHKDYGVCGNFSKGELRNYINRIVRNFMKINILVPVAYIKIMLLTFYDQGIPMFEEDMCIADKELQEVFLPNDNVNVSKVALTSIKELI